MRRGSRAFQRAEKTLFSSKNFKEVNFSPNLDLTSVLLCNSILLNKITISVFRFEKYFGKWPQKYSSSLIWYLTFHVDSLRKSFCGRQFLEGGTKLLTHGNASFCWILPVPYYPKIWAYFSFFSKARRTRRSYVQIFRESGLGG